MPVERKSMWRTAEERRMSDLTRVLEWLERRKGKKKQLSQKPKVTVVETPKAKEKEGKIGKKVTLRQPEGQPEDPRLTTRKKLDSSPYPSLYRAEQRGRRLSMFPGIYNKDSRQRSDLDIKDVIALESTPRPNIMRRQSMFPDPTFQENFLSGRRMTIIKDWQPKTSDITFERKMKSLMEKGTEPKIESVKMLKPEEVLSCRYLRLSRNNVRTLLKLCKDAGINMTIHPHMTESEIDTEMVFPPKTK
ncbi:uncharacterized protein C16orf78 homolog [Ctenodactylus gundi]